MVRKYPFWRSSVSGNTERGTIAFHMRLRSSHCCGYARRDTVSFYTYDQEVPIWWPRWKGYTLLLYRCPGSTHFGGFPGMTWSWLLHRLHGGSGSVQSIINRVCIGLVVFAQDGGLSWVEVRLGRPICTHVAQFVRMSSKKRSHGWRWD